MPWKWNEIMQFSTVAFILSLNLHFLENCKCSDSVCKVSDIIVVSKLLFL
jgi:hypothetical protein